MQSNVMFAEDRVRQSLTNAYSQFDYYGRMLAREVLQPDEEEHVRQWRRDARVRARSAGRKLASEMSRRTAFNSEGILARDLRDGMVVQIEVRGRVHAYTVSQVILGDVVSFHGTRESRGPGRHQDFAYREADPVIRLIGHYLGG